MALHRDIRCALLGDRHHGLSEGIRGLLQTRFDVVVMVADEPSLMEALGRLDADLAVVDLALSGEDGLQLLQRLRERFPGLKLIAISVHGEPGVSQAALRAGADAFVAKSAIATRLLPAVEEAVAAAGRGGGG
jgi:DNA-binding NarL/FixJ family response regulator